MDFKELIIKIITAGSGISSKRIVGVLAWVVILVVGVCCSIYGIQAPEIFESIIIAATTLLGVDSITNIWKKKS